MLFFINNPEYYHLVYKLVFCCLYEEIAAPIINNDDKRLMTNQASRDKWIGAIGLNRIPITIMPSNNKLLFGLTSELKVWITAATKMNHLKNS